MPNAERTAVLTLGRRDYTTIEIMSSEKVTKTEKNYEVIMI